MSTRRTSARFAPAANNLAWVLSEHGGDRDRALALAQTAKELAPEDLNLSDTLLAARSALWLASSSSAAFTPARGNSIRPLSGPARR